LNKVRNIKIINSKNLIFIIIFFAFIFRFIGISKYQFWRDEAFSVILSSKNFFEMISLGIKDTSGILYPVILWIWIKIFGNSEMSVRLMSLIFNIASIWILIRFASKYFKSNRFLWIILFSFNILMIFYSQEARIYSILIFLVLLSVYNFFNYIFFQKDRFKYILSSACLLYFHNLAVLVLLTQFLIIFALSLKNKKINKNYLVDYLLMLLFLIPWFLIFIYQFQLFHGQGFWFYFHPVDALVDFNSTLNSGLRLFYYDKYNYIHISIVLLNSILGFWGLINIFKSKNIKAIILSLFFIIPTIISYTISFVYPVFYLRYVIYIIPFYLFIQIYGLINLKKFIKIFIISILLISNFYVYFFVYLKQSYLKPDTKGLIEYIKDHKAGDQPIIHSNVSTFFPYEFYSYNDEKLESLIYAKEPVNYYDGKIIISDEMIIEQINYSSFWLIYFERQQDLMPDITSFKEEKKQCFNGEICVILLSQ